MLSTPASLLERLRQPKDAHAWDRFVELYSPLLFHWAKRLGLQESDAADLVQDVFLLLWRNLPKFEYDQSKSFHGWLKTLFLNRARQRWRERAPANLEVGWEQVSDPAFDLQAEQEYRHYLLHRAFQLVQREFSPQQTAAFREYVVAGRPVGDVARDLGLSAGAIYCIKSRVLNRLRQELNHLLD